MSKHIIQKILEKINSDSFEEECYELKNYSGKGMYGKQCLAVVTSTEEFGNLLSEITKTAFEMFEDDEATHIEQQDFFRSLRTINWDSFGLKMIVYFPSVHFDQNTNAGE